MKLPSDDKDGLSLYSKFLGVKKNPSHEGYEKITSYSGDMSNAD
jgi:hypothetical protein